MLEAEAAGSGGGKGGSTVTTGLILLVFIGLLIAYFTSRGRRRLGLPVTGRMWLAIIAGVVIIGLALWASSTHH